MNQEDVLYLTDPAGLRTIFSGERGDIYDEFPMIVQYVLREFCPVLWRLMVHQEEHAAQGPPFLIFQP